MGRLTYDGLSAPITIDDSTLAHLKIVIGTKLRRQESFLMTWTPGDSGQDQRKTIWMHPAIPLQLGFDSAVAPAIDPHRVAEIMDGLNSTGELVLDPQCTQSGTPAAHSAE